MSLLSKHRWLMIPVALLVLASGSSLQAESAYRKPFLWKIEGPSPSYLFGTIHFGDPRVAELPAVVAEAFDSSDAVYTEIPLDPRSQFEATSKLLLPDDQSLRDVLPEPLLERVNRYLGKIDPALTIEPLARLKVWALGVTLPLIDAQLRNSDRQALDLMLHTRAVRERKETGGLESVDEQIGVFDELVLDDQIEVLGDTLDYLEKLDAQGLRIADVFIEEYLRGDVDGLGRLMMEHMNPEDALDKQLLDGMLFKRNRLMAERIDALLKKDRSVSYFFAVGAGHYWTQQGVQALLREKGYSVVRVE